MDTGFPPQRLARVAEREKNMAHVLMAVTGADAIALTDGTTHPTGFWAEELVELHLSLIHI